MAAVRSVGRRVLRGLTLALLGYLVLAWFQSAGHNRTGIWVGAGLVLAVLAFAIARALRDYRARRFERWERAIFAPHLRARAIRELGRAVLKLAPPNSRTRTEHARLSVMLAELLDAEDLYHEAVAVIDAVPLAELSALEASLVRHTRAVTHLRASDAQGALQAIHARTPSGDVELDQRLSLLEAYARIELGDVAFGLATAERLITQHDVHESVQAEARVVRAAGLDAAGRREEALVVLAALGRDVLRPLSELGQPRARVLAKLALENSMA